MKRGLIMQAAQSVLDSDLDILTTEGTDADFIGITQIALNIQLLREIQEKSETCKAEQKLAEEENS